jgi:hypothetical protein|tara:strand:+ start:12900 stop:13568 length:669 start_codon:yes stop_codon:yes gene_type:complete
LTSKNIINWDTVFKNSEVFQNNKPFTFGFIENFFAHDFYEELYNTYPKLDDEKWIVVDSDFGRHAKRRWFGNASPHTEQASIDQEDSTLSIAWNNLFHYLHSKEFLENMSIYSGIKLTGFKHFSFMLNEKGSFNMPHTHHPNEKKENYAYNLTFLAYFAKDWKQGDPGGTYLASEEDESSIIFEPYNLDNTCVIFAETPRSFHGSRYMTQDNVRRSIQFTLI